MKNSSPYIKMKETNFSLIIPTYNEKDNIIILINRIKKMNIVDQLIFVDDNSPDGTGKLLEKIKKKEKILVIHNKKKIGLTPAIALGFKKAEGDLIGVMDGDLSHPPEVLYKMFNIIQRSQPDILLGSRNIKGGAVEVWPFSRKLISIVSTTMAKFFTKVKDPMSGFFIVKREVIKNLEFESKGYKILLEILVKGKYKKVREIPYIFVNRNQGKSKLCFNEYLKFLRDYYFLTRFWILKRLN